MSESVPMLTASNNEELDEQMAALGFVLQTDRRFGRTWEHPNGWKVWLATWRGLHFQSAKLVMCDDGVERWQHHCTHHHSDNVVYYILWADGVKRQDYYDSIAAAVNHAINKQQALGEDWHVNSSS